jgi:hypothetical protein
MNQRVLLLVGVVIIVAAGIVFLNDGEEQVNEEAPGKPPVPDEEPTEAPAVGEASNYPKIASWLAKKDELIESGKPYDLVMAGWFTPEEAAQFRENNPDVLLLAGLTTTWVYDNEDWMSFLVTVANHGRDEAIEITEEMYLHDSEGERCAFGWASEEWGHGEIYAMDPRNEDWASLVVNFYETVLAQPSHDGIIVDMVVERQYWGQDAITDEEWTDATKAIYRRTSDLNTDDKLVIFNAGARLSDIDDYSMYFDGYLMENFMGSQLKTTFSEGLEAVNGDKMVIYGVDTDDTGVADMKKMRLGLALSLMGDNTYYTYDFGPRDHGQAWWYPEYDADLGEPLGEYYERDGVYWREFDNGFVVAAPDGASVSFDEEYTDVTSGEASMSFTVEEGDGRIFLKASTS